MKSETRRDKHTPNIIDIDEHGTVARGQVNGEMNSSTNLLLDFVMSLVTSTRFFSFCHSVFRILASIFVLCHT